MVLLELGSGHPEFRDCIIETGIRIQDESENCREYAFDDGSADKSYVASMPGMQYVINVHVDNPAWQCVPMRKTAVGQSIIRADVSIDGSHVRSILILQNGTSQIKCKQQGDIRYNLVFDTPLIVSDGGISDKHATDKIGTIEVSFQVRIVASMAPQRAAVDALSESSLAINESAKKGALISSTTRFSLGAPRHSARWSTTPYSRDLRVGHTFHYKTKDFLEMEGIIPESNPVDAAPESHATPVETNTEHAKIEAKKEENEEDDIIEFVISKPEAKRPVELVDLTTATSEPKRRGRTSSSCTVIDVDTPLVMKREKTVARKRGCKVEIIDLT